MLLSRYFEHIGHQVTKAQTGDDAIRAFQASVYDVVILAAKLPDIDGYEAIRRLKALTTTRWTPIILMGDANRPEDQIEAFQAGADDYLSTPINLTVMAYKLKALQRTANMQATLSNALVELENYRQKNEQELALARHMMRQLCNLDEIDAPHVRYLNRPAGSLSGDVIAAATAGNSVQYFLLADITGHGLASALHAIPLVQDFVALARQGLSLSRLCREINRRLYHVLPLGYFVAALIVRIDRAGKHGEIWNGGLPTLWFLSSSGEVEQHFSSIHPAFGILNDHEFDSASQALTWSSPGQLVMFTDGLLEATATSGEIFGEDRLLKAIRRISPSADLAEIENELDAFMSGSHPHDDWSLMTVCCE